MAFNLSVTAQELNNAVAKANAAALQSTTYTKTETDTLLSGKVNAETGKGLSTNDFTTAEKNNLALLTIFYCAQRKYNSHVYYKGFGL